jgi:PAS domain S-box-containing protein
MSDQYRDLEGMDDRVLLLLPTARDQEVTRGILAAAGISSFPCANINEVCREAARGAGAAILTEEAVLTGGFVPLLRYLKEQPAWSDLPVIVLTAAGEESSERTNALLRVGHMMLVKRPVDVSALVTTVQCAIRDRRRQYQVRELIAEHERQAAMIRLSEEKFRTLADNVQQIFWTCRAYGQCDYLSRQGVEYTGIPEAQQLGLKWLRLVIHPDDQERTLAAWREAVEDRRTYDLEFRIRRFDGEYHWFKTRGTPIRDDQDKIVK